MNHKTIFQKSCHFYPRLWSLALLIILFGNSYGQPIEVSGTVSTAMIPVQHALVTFMANDDTNRQYSALTNSCGKYSIHIISSISLLDNRPDEFQLEQNYPNPFSSATTITYRLSRQSEVIITIFNILGREVRKFAIGAQTKGEHQVLWDGLNNDGAAVAPGIYFCRLQAGEKTQVRKMLLSTIGNDAVALLSKTHSSQPGKIDRANFMLQVEFTVRITNTDSTTPVIVPKQFNNIIVQPGAILNFDVDEYIDPNAAIVLLDSTHQIIRGFGAANIQRWRPDMTADQIEKAFGTDDGEIGLTILRLRIPPDAPSFGYNIPTARAAYSRGVKIIASPWSPPASMKTNNNLVGGHLRESAYADYAAHLKSFADYLRSNGIPLYALSIQNEPDVQVTYESCDWTADEMLKFVKENAPAIGADIIVPESFNFNHTMSDPILNDSIAASHVAIIGGHIYGGGLCSYPLAESKGKEIWMTEHLDTDTSWAKVLATGKEINDCMFVGMNAYIWWYIVRFYGPIKEDGNVSKRGYVMSQFARFIRPGYFRVDATQRPQPQVYVTAYKGNGAVVIVAINQRSTCVEQEFIIRNGEVGAVTPYVTSITENAAQKQAIVTRAGRFTATLAASSITTFVSQ